MQVVQIFPMPNPRGDKCEARVTTGPRAGMACMFAYRSVTILEDKTALHTCDCHEHINVVRHIKV
jgi:hypothetical protein